MPDLEIIEPNVAFSLISNTSVLILTHSRITVGS